MVHENTTLKGVKFNDVSVKSWTHNGKNVFLSGNNVTYRVINKEYTEFVQYGESCLSPKTFTPTFNGWTFVGWKEDTSANANVLSSKVMGSQPITLHAVFRQSVTLSYNGNGATGGSVAEQTGYKYVNGSNSTNPTFVLRNNAFTRSDYTFTKWARNSATGTQFYAGSSVTLEMSTTFYAIWTPNEFYWIKDGVVQNGFPSTYENYNVSYNHYLHDNTLTGASVCGSNEGNTTFTGETASVPTRGHKYVEITMNSVHVSGTSGNSGRLDNFLVALNECKDKVAPNAVITVDVSNVSAITLRLVMTAWAWGNWMYHNIKSIRFYS